jgi:hypothetical protein
VPRIEKHVTCIIDLGKLKEHRDLYGFPAYASTWAEVGCTKLLAQTEKTPFREGKKMNACLYAK